MQNVPFSTFPAAGIAIIVIIVIIVTVLHLPHTCSK
jgi:hypothetical protein